MGTGASADDVRAQVSKLGIDATRRHIFLCCDQTKPNASSLNYTTGVTRAVQVVSALSATGTVCVSSSQAVNLIIDAAGSSM